MFKRVLIAAAMAGVAATATMAQEAAPTCEGDMTIERLSDPACTYRIAIPTFRDEGSTKKAELAPIDPPVYIDAPAADGSTRSIRMVGARFLEPQDERIDFRARNAEHANVLDRMMFATASYLGLDERDATQTVGVDTQDKLVIEDDVAALTTAAAVTF